MHQYHNEGVRVILGMRIVNHKNKKDYVVTGVTFGKKLKKLSYDLRCLSTGETITVTNELMQDRFKNKKIDWK